MPIYLQKGDEIRIAYTDTDANKEVKRGFKRVDIKKIVEKKRKAKKAK